jgi:hypothetical protein
MRYIVAVHANSAIGYACAQSHGRIQVGAETHVAFECSEIDTSNPSYLYVKTVPNERGGVEQQLQFPHSAVLFIVHAHGSRERLIGFELS